MASDILIVDDEPQITRVLRTSMQSHGYEVEVAKDGVLVNPVAPAEGEPAK